MAEETVFHKIIAGDIPCEKVYEDDDVLGFKDIHPKAPTHVLFVAKKSENFVRSIADLTDSTAHVPCLLVRTAQRFAQEQGIDGYKLTFHVGKGGGQEVFYLHVHFLSQQPLRD